MKKDITIVILFGLLAYPLVVLAAHYTQSYNFTRQKKIDDIIDPSVYD